MLFGHFRIHDRPTNAAVYNRDREESLYLYETSSAVDASVFSKKDFGQVLVDSTSWTSTYLDDGALFRERKHFGEEMIKGSVSPRSTIGPHHRRTRRLCDILQKR